MSDPADPDIDADLDRGALAYAASILDQGRRAEAVARDAADRWRSVAHQLQVLIRSLPPTPRLPSHDDVGTFDLLIDTADRGTVHNLLVEALGAVDRIAAAYVRGVDGALAEHVRIAVDVHEDVSHECRFPWPALAAPTPAPCRCGTPWPFAADATRVIA